MRFSFTFLLLFTLAASSAADYEVCLSGDYDSNSGNSSVRLSSDGGATCNINPHSITWVAGDQLIIPAGFDLIVSANWSIPVDITVDVYGSIYFDGGKLDLTAGSGIILNPGSNLACGTPGAEVNCGNNEQIRIGTTQFKANDIDDIDDLPKPSSVDENGAQPVELLYFTAQEKETVVELNWATATEIDNEYFTLERSVDGFNYEVIGRLEGNGTTVETNYYSYTDAYPFYGLSYYRLSQTDYDGKFEVFRPVSIYRTALNDFVVYPNPVEQNEEFILITTASAEEHLVLEIYTMQGSQLESTSDFANGRIQLKADVNPGMYLLKVLSGARTITKQVVVN